MAESFCRTTQQFCRTTIGTCRATKVFVSKSVTYTVMIMLAYKGRSEHIFSFIGFSEIML